MQVIYELCAFTASGYGSEGLFYEATHETTQVFKAFCWEGHSEY